MSLYISLVFEDVRVYFAGILRRACIFCWRCACVFFWYLKMCLYILLVFEDVPVYFAQYVPVYFAGIWRCACVFCLYLKMCLFILLVFEDVPVYFAGIWRCALYVNHIVSAATLNSFFCGCVPSRPLSSSYRSGTLDCSCPELILSDSRLRSMGGGSAQRTQKKPRTKAYIPWLEFTHVT
jgi:hypothetical protein